MITSIKRSSVIPVQCISYHTFVFHNRYNLYHYYISFNWKYDKSKLDQVNCNRSWVDSHQQWYVYYGLCFRQKSPCFITPTPTPPLRTVFVAWGRVILFSRLPPVRLSFYYVLVSERELSNKHCLLANISTRERKQSKICNYAHNFGKVEGPNCIALFVRTSLFTCTFRLAPVSSG